MQKEKEEEEMKRDREDRYEKGKKMDERKEEWMGRNEKS